MEATATTVSSLDKGKSARVNKTNGHKPKIESLKPKVDGGDLQSINELLQELSKTREADEEQGDAEEELPDIEFQ